MTPTNRIEVNERFPSPIKSTAHLPQRPQPHQYLPLSPPLTPDNSFTITAGFNDRCNISTRDDDEDPSDGSASIPELDLDATPSQDEEDEEEVEIHGTDDWHPSLLHTIQEEESDEQERYAWREGMSEEERDRREAWLCEKRGRKGLRIVIVTENFLPKVDGVTRTLSRLLEHLHASGHSCILLGPSSTLSTYASHPLVGTLGIPLVVYPGLKLNFLRPKFLSVIRDWKPDVVHLVDPIWLGAQTILAMELGWAGESWTAQDGETPRIGKGLGGAVVASYHTNLATYATLFGASFLTPLIWAFQSSLYSKLRLTLCPSPSTKGILESQSFDGVRLWPRGVDLGQFSPKKRCGKLRASWGVSVGASGWGSASGNEVVEVEVVAKLKPTEAGVKEVRKGDRSEGIIGAGGLMTPPSTPWNGPVDAVRESHAASEPGERDTSDQAGERTVLLYVGRISWEKNLHLLLAAYSHLASAATTTTTNTNDHHLPKLVFVGDGPARGDLEAQCAKQGWERDVIFMGHLSGEELARCYASADVFVFPSFTETFGQVVLEALASGLPVIGLDAEGTRDLVSHESTGLLLPLPSTFSAASSSPSSEGSGSYSSSSSSLSSVPVSNSAHTPITTLAWAEVCKPDSTHFELASRHYADLISRAVGNKALRMQMGSNACTVGIEGYTWWDAMEACVDGYRESMRIARARRNLTVNQDHHPVTSSPSWKDGPCEPTPTDREQGGIKGEGASPPISHAGPRNRRGLSLINRVVSKRLAYRPRPSAQGYSHDQDRGRTLIEAQCDVPSNADADADANAHVRAGLGSAALPFDMGMIGRRKNQAWYKDMMGWPPVLRVLRMTIILALVYGMLSHHQVQLDRFLQSSLVES